jgi:HAD superfamily hydrolase (TIGR01509 family)
MKDKYFIFDMDGTLYQFDQGKSSNFTGSKFHSDLKLNIYSFLKQKLNLTPEEAVKEYDRIKEIYLTQVSLGFEKEHSIDRYDFFKNTWIFEPSLYINRNPLLPKLFSILSPRIAVLTAAPRVWAEEALKYLGIYEFVKDRLFTGEPDLRKPNPQIFVKIAKSFGTNPENVYSIGDQEHSDIIPAKEIGMKTIIVGSKSEHADYQISTINELLSLLEEIK